MDPRTFKKYRRKIAKMEPKVDNKPPKFDAAVYYKGRNLLNEQRQKVNIDKQNMKLLQKMNIIVRSGGKVDCWMPHIKYKTNFEYQDTINKGIEKNNKDILKRIRQAGTQYPCAGFVKHWKSLKMQLMHSKKSTISLEEQEKDILEQNPDYCMVKDISLLNEMNPPIRTRCFFEIMIQGAKQKLGYVVFELFDDIVPRTCANFSAFCRGSNGMSYKNTPFHRIVPGYLCQGGDTIKFNGTGGTSIYGDSFENENFKLCHARPGILSMCNSDQNANDSKFNITFARVETMNGKGVVFGKIISGLQDIYKIEEFGTKTGKPIKTIIISNCGILQRKHIRSTKNGKRAKKVVEAK